MRRAAVLLGFLVVAAAAALLPAPVPEAQPPATTAPPTPEPLAFATCPWSFTDGLADSAIVAVSDADRSLTLSFPVDAVERPIEVVGPGAAVVRQSAVGAGLSPFVAEFSSVPASIGVTTSSDSTAAGLTCPNIATKLWLLAGGSTVDQLPLDLILFNPFPEDANVELRLVSENGAEPLTELEDVAVPAGSVRTIDLALLLPSRLHLAVAVDDPEGLITPAFRAGRGDQDWSLLAGTGLADRWEFPVAGLDGFDAQLVLVNDGPITVTGGIDFFTPEGSILAAAEVVLEPRRLTVIEVDPEVAGVAIDADGPLGAAVVGEAFGARYAVSGVDRTSAAWYLTPGAPLEQPVTIRVMNTGAAQITVSVTPIGQAGTAADPIKVSVPAGAIREVELIGALAAMLESGGPFSAGWYWSAGAATAASHGIPVSP